MITDLTSNLWRVAIRRVRKERHVTQQELAHMTGVRQARISQLESGQAEPKLVEAIELAKALNVSMTMVPDDMLGVVIDTIREHERKDQSDRARTIPELILGDRAYS